MLYVIKIILVIYGYYTKRSKPKSHIISNILNINNLYRFDSKGLKIPWSRHAGFKPERSGGPPPGGSG